MKTGLLKIMYANPFGGLDHEDTYAHLTKFYENMGMLGALENEEQLVYLWLFPNSIIGKVDEWYLDQPTSTIKNGTCWRKSS